MAERVRDTAVQGRHVEHDGIAVGGAAGRQDEQTDVALHLRDGHAAREPWHRHARQGPLDLDELLIAAPDRPSYGAEIADWFDADVVAVAIRANQNAATEGIVPIPLLHTEQVRGAPGFRAGFHVSPALHAPHLPRRI